MTPKDALELARLLGKTPGLKPVDLKDVQKLAELLQEHPEVGSIELRGFFDTGVVITRTGSGVPASATPMVASMHHAPVAPAAAPHAAAPAGGGSAAPAPAASSLKDVKSPMVGTFYKSPEPGADPYVKVGSRIAVGQTVCIIEAMKIMNEIEAEVTGVVREICVEDSQPVEFGQVLFRVDPNG